MKEESKEISKQPEVKQVESSLLIESTKPAFKLPDGETVDLNDYLIWLGNLIYNMSKKLW